MTDDEQPDGRALREQLDTELTGVHATAGSRERLRTRIAVRSPDRQRDPQGWRRLGPAFAVPLAMAGVVAAVVAVPVLLRAGSTGTQPASPVPGVSVSAPPTAVPSVGPTRASTRPSPVAAASAEPTPIGSTVPLKVVVTPRIVKPGQRVVLKGGWLVDLFGTVRVDWGDGGSSTVPGAMPCSRTAAQNQRARQKLMKKEGIEAKQLSSISHVYPQAGKFALRVVLTPCGSGALSETTLRVDVLGPIAPGSSPSSVK